MKISVITLNPGVDRIAYLPSPARLGTLNRAERTVVSQGSKGANVAIMLRRLGHGPAYFTFTGGALGGISESFTDREGVDGRFTEAACGVRMNVKIIDSDGACTEFNERGGPVTPDELSALVTAALDYRPDLVVINGSLPQGVPPDIYGRLVAKFNEMGAYTVLDADGDAMRHGLAARPRLIKPNVRELSGIVGCDESELYSPDRLSDAMLATRARFGCDVICTLDSRGAVGLCGAEKIGCNNPAGRSNSAGCNNPAGCSNPAGCVNPAGCNNPADCSNPAGCSGPGAADTSYTADTADTADTAEMWRVSAAPVRLRGFSGAGDTFLAAYLHRRLLGDTAPQSLAYAAAAAGAKVELEGTRLPDPARTEQLLPYIKTEKLFIKNS